VLKQEVRVLRRKAILSFTTATTAFNSPADDGRVTQVLLNLQHAFEMLLKASLIQVSVPVFDKKGGRSIGFASCVRQAQSNKAIKLSDTDAGTLRALDAMRDDEQHWFNEVNEQILYLHARAAVSLFDDLLQRVFGDHLADHLPIRVLPLSVDPPRDLALILDEEYSQIAALLKPGRRARHHAHARIRTLLAMEAHVEEDTIVSSKDVVRVEKGITAGLPRSQVFPRLGDIATIVDGEGLAITVHFTKKRGAPVHYVSDETAPAAAVRQVDLQKKFHLSPTDLASTLGITGPRCVALRRHLGIDSDLDCIYVFTFKSSRHPQYSDKAVTRMRQAIAQLDMDQVWKAHNPSSRRATGDCAIKGCAAS
jgi:hypothetical protein